MRIARPFGASLVCGALLFVEAGLAQELQELGKSIGTVATQGNLIVMTFDENALGKVNLFDLAHRTLRFTPDGAGYRIANLPLEWVSDSGSEMRSAQVMLHNCQFPFSAKNWDASSVGVSGSIRSGATVSCSGACDGAHWVKGLHAPVVSPYQRPTEASAMGGGVWQDNFDGRSRNRTTTATCRRPGGRTWTCT